MHLRKEMQIWSANQMIIMMMELKPYMILQVLQILKLKLLLSLYSPKKKLFILVFSELCTN